LREKGSGKRGNEDEREVGNEVHGDGAP
jgi:hypothetical protein